MFKKIKALEKASKKLAKFGLAKAKRKLRPIKRDLAFVYDFATSPHKYDFEFTFEDNDIL